LPVEAVTHIQSLRLLKQRLGVVQLADTQAAIGERHPCTLAVLGYLAKRGTRTALFTMAQIEVRIKVENADPRMRVLAWRK
jgi:hypothetical protein